MAPDVRRRELKVFLWMLGNRGAVERAVNGAIRSAIDAHGPVTRDNSHSAAKRVVHALAQVAANRRRVLAG